MRRVGTSLRRARWLPALLFLVACENAPTQVVVRFEAEPVSARRARTLHVRVLSQEGEVRLDRSVAIGDNPGQVRFPTRVPVVPLEGDASRVFRVEAELADATETVFSEQRAILGFVRDELFEVAILFDDACIGELDCPDDTTCRESVCVDARIPVGEVGPAVRSERQVSDCTNVCWESPRPSPSFLQSVCLDPVTDLAIAVGSGGRAYERRGGVWNPVSTMSSGAIDIACLGGEDAVSVGRQGAIAARRDGVWSVESSGITTDLRAVSGDRDEVWAVGDGGVVLRRRGGVWQSLDAGTTMVLDEVAYASPAEVWISGAARTLLRYDGAAFVAIDGPTDDETDLYDEATIAGEDLLLRVFDVDGRRPIFRRGSDGVWLPEFDPSLGITDLSAHRSGWLAGPGGRGDLFVRPPGGAWELVGTTGGDNLTGAAAGDGVAYYVGPEGEIARWSRDDGMTFEVERATERALLDVATHPNDPIFAVAVGAEGAILERVAESRWRARAIEDGDTIVRVELGGVYVGETSAFAVGGDGVIAERNEAGDWTRVSSPVTETLHAVHGSGDRVVAVGATGVVIERVAGEWTVLVAPTAENSALNAVHVSAGGRVHVGAESGEVRRLDGDVWTTIGTAAPDPIRAIRGDGSAVYAAAASSILRVDESALVPLPSPSDGQLVDVGVRDGRAVFVLARLLFEETASGYVPLDADGHALAMTPDGIGIVVGQNGRIARTILH